MKKICMYLMNGMADHEHGYLLTALSSQIEPKYEFCTVALSKEPIITMGGLKIIPDYILNEVNEQELKRMQVEMNEIYKREKNNNYYE